MTTKFTLVFASLLTATLQLSAQSKNNISGLVKDNSDNPVQSATVSLLKSKGQQFGKSRHYRQGRKF